MATTFPNTEPGTLPPSDQIVDPAAPPPDGAGELDLFAFFLVLRLHLLRIVICAFVAFGLMAIYTLKVKPRFSSTASMLIPQGNNSAAGMALQAAAGLDLVGGGNEIYVDILKSRVVLDRLIAQYNLENHYGVKEMDKAEEILLSRTTLASSREGLLQVTVTDQDPRLAADLANSYLVELDHENQNLAVTSASQQRRYYQQEMVKEKDALADAEVALKQTEEKTGVIEPTAQLQASLGATENTRAQLRARQVELGALLQSETPQNPDVIRVRGEVASLESQLQALQSQGGPAAGTPTAKAPAEVLNYVRMSREVKFHETLFEMLARQYETAKEQEARDISMIEVLDKAVPAAHKSWPPRTLYCVAAFFVGAVLGIFWTLIEQLLQTVLRNPANREQLLAFARGKPNAATR